jgi:hypothetical protein
MNRPEFEVADAIRRFGPEFEERFGHTMSSSQRQAVRDIVRCRTAALGGHVEVCDQCGHRQVAYNSCRNRNCPKCQAAARGAWLDRQAADLLPVEYFHVVFTLPDAIGPVALQNPRLIYSALFRSASDSLLELAADPKHLGVVIGALAVLHTWGQTLTLHPHVHCVVPGGGLSRGGQSWISCRSGFLLPVRPLSRLFRGKFLAALSELFQCNRLTLAGSQRELADAQRFAKWVNELRATEWVVYAKPPFGGPQQVLKYLARYTHRVAISNRRLVGMDDHSVSFRWKDYADASGVKVMTLDGVEFVRRFLQHVLPSGFVRIRHFGLLANRCREEKLNHCRQLLAAPPPLPVVKQALEHELQEDADSRWPCPACGTGRLIVTEVILPSRRSRSPSAASATDTS